jgi:Ca2+-binding EF-hand superfamily protein
VNERHLQRIYDLFKAVDKDKSGTIDQGEFHKMFNEQSSPFITHLFESMGMRGCARQARCGAMR